MNTSRRLVRALLVAAALAAPIAVAAPAHASTASNGCTVTPKTPYHNGDFTAAGLKRIAYEVEITCVAGVTITVEEQRWEEDANQSDDFIGDSSLVRAFPTADTITWTITGTLPDTDDLFDMYEEMYQKVHFKVTSGPVTSGWTNWERSGVRSIHV
ncbi:hypothetical protein Cs7R123_62440 [Catellatospora sp. TT07R-123]|uniref:hypothetical protein n=1 Tax=Catellatospora sp. TT07R-123 TaxID=2733863 RepID=UPI001B06AB21|nr:hypothetical protein [Catellatospora sp. TT07R-123]GHJ48902.1 hypothetical protein Cs7R123_62440 [Catellatospora sp. TT07R-123]